MHGPGRLKMPRQQADILPYNSGESRRRKTQKCVRFTLFCQVFTADPTTFVLLKISPDALAGAPFDMTLALSDVKRLAVLAQLELSDDAAARTLDKLNDIFGLVEQMRSVDTRGVEPLTQPITAYDASFSLRLREDQVTEPNRRQDYQQPAPATQDGLYLVPKVIE